MVIVDTGFWLALGNGKDKHHARAVKVLAGIREPLVTTWPVLTETLSHGRILSTDQRDFHAYRWKQHEPFENLFQD